MDPVLYLEQFFGEVPAVPQAVQVGYEFLAAHALPNILWPEHVERGAAGTHAPFQQQDPWLTTLNLPWVPRALPDPIPGLGLGSPLPGPPQALTCPCRSVLRSMMAQVKVCTQSAPTERKGHWNWDSCTASAHPAGGTSPMLLHPHGLAAHSHQSPPSEPAPPYLLRRKARGCSDGSAWRTGTGSALVPGSPH